MNTRRLAATALGPARGSAMLEAGSDRSSARAKEDYVKAIYRLSERGPVKAADVARYLGVTPVSVHKAKRVLDRDGLLSRTAAAGQLVLTAQGARLAVAVVRRHRLLETFLHRVLDVPLERVHAEAERIEHVITDDIAARLARYLAFPVRDPHGHVIPYGDGETPDVPLPLLASVDRERSVEIASIDDRNAEIVGALAAAGVLPGVTVRATPLADGGFRLQSEALDVAVRAAWATHIRIAAAAASSTDAEMPAVQLAQPPGVSSLRVW